MEIRKVGGKRFVNEERLIQFQRDIQNSITASIVNVLIVPINNCLLSIVIKTPQHNYFKISCLEMLLRTSHTNQVNFIMWDIIVFCIFRFLLWYHSYILWPYFSQTGHSFHSYFVHIILVIKAFLL